MIKDTRQEWRKSSKSGGDNGDCVEVNNTLDGVRDSKNPDGPVLTVDLRPLIAAVRDGRIT